VTESEIQFLREHIDNSVEIEISDGERLIAKVLFVTGDEEYDEHELTHQVISSSQLETYSNLENAGGYVLDFGKIVSVKPLN
jgi:hypothetical protein